LCFNFSAQSTLIGTRYGDAGSLTCKEGFKISTKETAIEFECMVSVVAAVFLLTFFFYPFVPLSKHANVFAVARRMVRGHVTFPKSRATRLRAK